MKHCMTKKIKLGQDAKDKITGFAGIVYGITEWMNGCRRIGVRSRELKDGKPINIEWFDEDDVEAVRVVKLAKPKPTGGPQSDPSQSRPGER